MNRETLHADERESKKRWRTRYAAKGVGLVLFCLAMAGVGGSLAYFRQSEWLTNMMGTKSSAVSLNENFNPASTFLPEETVTKQVYFRNTGEQDLVLRVKIADEYWADQNGNKLTDEQAFDTTKVIKNWTAYWWDYYDSASDNNGNGNTDGKDKSELEWTKLTTTKADGNAETYYYYNLILPVGGATKHILDSVKLSPEVSNDRHAADYSGKQYVLDFQAEAIPYYGESGEGGNLDEIASAWGVNCTIEGSGDAKTLKWANTTGSNTGNTTVP